MYLTLPHNSASDTLHSHCQSLQLVALKQLFRPLLVEETECLQNLMISHYHGAVSQLTTSLGMHGTMGSSSCLHSALLTSTPGQIYWS